MSQSAPLDDPSAIPEVQREVTISRSHAERYRWTCPHGHVDWDRTNNHVFCRTCSRMNEAGENIDPEHYHILDKQSGEKIPWEKVELKE